MAEYDAAHGSRGCGLKEFTAGAARGHRGDSVQCLLAFAGIQKLERKFKQTITNTQAGLRASLTNVCRRDRGRIGRDRIAGKSPGTGVSAFERLRLFFVDLRFKFSVNIFYRTLANARVVTETSLIQHKRGRRREERWAQAVDAVS